MRAAANGGKRVAAQFVHPGGRLRIVGGDVGPDIGAVLLGLRRPDEPHESRSTWARAYSRRITIQHRVVYQVLEKERSYVRT